MKVDNFLLQYKVNLILEQIWPEYVETVILAKYWIIKRPNFFRVKLVACHVSYLWSDIFGELGCRLQW